MDAGASVSVIPPYCYGSNDVITNNPATQTTPTFTLVNNIPLYRQGGNRLTAYNWENNASNAGMDWGPNHEDWYMVPGNVTPPGLPATTLTNFILNNNAVTAASLVTLQMAGYVSADGNCNCDVTITGAADTSGTYWKAVSFSGGPSSGAPVTTDNVVYMDEEMYYLLATVGSASSGGALFYDLDNEPGIWSGTHPLVHPAQAACSEVAGKGVSLATVITSIDPVAQVLGPVAYGWGEYTNNQGAPDAGNLSSYDNGNYVPYLNYYLATMSSASNSAGRRLLHYLDLHWYPEATGSNGASQVRITNDDTSQGVAVARMQAPRSLWDPSYTEISWIAQNSLPNTPVTLIPRLQAAVSQYYPGTKLFFSEYQYGSGEDVSGGVAQADALGIFGKYGVGACRWDDGTNNAYVGAAYNLYLNYNGAGASFGNLSMPVSVPSASITLASGYAARSNIQPNKIWIVALSRNYSSASVTDTGSFTIANLSGGQGISSIKSYRFDSTHSTLYSPTTAPVTASAASFSDSLPGRSGTLYEITLSQSFNTLTPTSTSTSTGTPTPTHTATPTSTGTIPTYTFTPSPTPTPTATKTLTPTWTPTATPPGCPVLFNACDTLTDNGTWNPPTSGVTYHSALSLSTLNVTQGSHSLAVAVTTNVRWNNEIMNLTGFSPNVWTGVGQVIMDVYVSPSLISSGTTYSQLVLAASSAALGQWQISNYAWLNTGANSVTLNIDYSAGGLSRTDTLTELYFIFNTDSTGTGTFYLDNIRLVQSPCPFTSTPTFSPTSSPAITSTPSLTSTRTPSPSATLTPTLTLSPTLTMSPTPWPTGVPTYTYTDTPTATDTLISTDTPASTPSLTITWTQTGTYSPTATPTPNLTITPTIGITVGPPVVWPNPLRNSGPVTLQLTLNNSKPSKVTVRLFTTVLRMVQRQEYDGVPAGLVRFQVPISPIDKQGKPLANGLYYIAVDSSAGRTILKWLILR